MKKECDLLLAIIEKKKAELLENINSAYNDKLNELHETIRRCDKTLQQSLGLVEFSEEAFKENNPVTFLQVLDKIRCVYNINNNTLGPNLCVLLLLQTSSALKTRYKRYMYPTLPLIMSVINQCLN